jgi:hypothetical protein
LTETHGPVVERIRPLVLLFPKAELWKLPWPMTPIAATRPMFG